MVSGHVHFAGQSPASPEIVVAAICRRWHGRGVFKHLALVVSLAACHAPAAPPQHAISVVAEAPHEHAPGRADLSDPAQTPLAEMVVTGHEPCAGSLPRTPQPPALPTRGPLLIARAIGGCRPIVKHPAQLFGYELQ